MGELELYLHIPFCAKKCAYCDFLSGPCEDADTIAAYICSLQQEIRIKSEACRGRRVVSVFIGGGTPSYIAADYIVDLMDTVRYFFTIDEEAEVTMEVNPGTVTKESLRRYKEAGINRISIGLQSAKNVELRMLGRIHTYEKFLESYDLIRKAGFTNVNVDLMSALPGQTIESWKKTLQSVVMLRPEHISAYSLQIEEGTPFYELYEADLLARERGEEPELLPSEEVERAMYVLTKEELDQAGYSRYEISNYARRGKECRHNNGYWTGVPYLGLGLGASSFLDDVRYKNEEDLETYIDNGAKGIFPRKEEHNLSRHEKMEEFMFLGLRRQQGIERGEFLRRFDMELEAMYGDVLNKLIAAGLLYKEEGRIALTDAGIDVSNVVLAEFLLDR